MQLVYIHNNDYSNMNNNIKHKCFVCTSVCLDTYLKKKERKERKEEKTEGKFSDFFVIIFKKEKWKKERKKGSRDL